MRSWDEIDRDIERDSEGDTLTFVASYVVDVVVADVGVATLQIAGFVVGVVAGGEVLDIASLTTSLPFVALIKNRLIKHYNNT